MFGTSGIRGDVVDKVNAELALKVGTSLATFLGGRGNVVVGYDIRTSSQMLENAAVSGLLAGGCDAVRIGAVPTPVLAFTTREISARAGIMITGSHNPPADNGLKCYDEQGMEYLPGEEEALEGLILDDAYKLVTWDKLGEVREVFDAVDRYIEAAMRVLKPVSRRLTVILDCSNGVGSYVTPHLLSKMGCRVVTMNAQLDGFFPGRPSEPTPENLGALARSVREAGADIGIAHDGDADRFSVVDEKGRYIGDDRVLALFAKKLVEDNRGGLVIASIDTSNCVEEVVVKAGGRLERAPLGKIHVALRDRQAVMACEPWKIINPAWGLWGDGCYSACLLAEMLAEQGGTVRELFSKIPDYPKMQASIDCPDELKKPVILRISETLSKERNVLDVWTFDGIRINYRDGSWLLIRASGTEPVVRVYAEGKTVKQAKELVNKGVKIVRGAINEGELPKKLRELEKPR